MVKLVEEFKIDSEVLANALVKAGVVDEAFADGNVYHIDCEYGINGVNTYRIEVEKEVSLKDIKGNKGCDTDIPEFPYKDESLTGGYEEVDESLTAQQGIKAEDFANSIADAISKGLFKENNSSPITVVIDALSGNNNDAEKFAQEFIKRINNIKGGF